MACISEAPCRPGLLATSLRLLAIGAAWLALVTLATGVFFTLGGADARPALNDIVAFAFSVAIAGAAAAITVFGIGGRKMWAIQLAEAASLLIAIAALPVVYLLWFDPDLMCWWMDVRSFERVQEIALRWVKSLAGYHAPLGALAGIALGAAAGLLIRLGRRRPRLATGTALAILLALASDRGRQFTVALLPWLRWLRYQLVPFSVASDQVSITGIIFGAVAGSAVAGLALHAARSRAGGASPESRPAGENRLPVPR